MRRDFSVPPCHIAPSELTFSDQIHRGRVYTSIMSQDPTLADVRVEPPDPHLTAPKAAPREARTPEVTEDGVKRFQRAYGLRLGE
jgi:hypothetical protein